MFRGKRIAFLLISIFLAACTPQSNVSDSLFTFSEPTVSYKTETVKQSEFVLESSGALRVYYPNVSHYFCEFEHAYLQEFCVKQGDEVHTGDTLARFFFDDNHLQIREQKLAYEEAVFQMETRSNSFRNTITKQQQALAEAKTESEIRIAQLQLEKAQIEYAAYQEEAAAALESIAEQIAALEAVSEPRTLLATTDGIVSQIATLQPGDEVSTSSVFLTTYDADSYYFAVSNDLAYPFPYGSKVSITFHSRSGLPPITGSVVASTAGIHETLDNSNTLIRPDKPLSLEALDAVSSASGYTALFDGVLLIPKSAVRTETNSELTYVYILEQDSPQKRYIICGPSNDEVVCVLDGLTEGQSIVIH